LITKCIAGFGNMTSHVMSLWRTLRNFLFCWETCFVQNATWCAE